MTSSSFISLSFITVTPSHFLSLTLDFSVIINNPVTVTDNVFRVDSQSQVSDRIDKQDTKTQQLEDNIERNEEEIDDLEVILVDGKEPG